MADYGEYVDQKPSEDALKRLTALARQQREAEQAVEDAQEALSKAQERLRTISETDVPNLMDEVGMTEFVTVDGLKITVDRKLRIGVPKAKKGQAMEWVDSHGGAALVQRCFVIRFGKEDERWAKKFARDLAQRKRPVNCERQNDVHSSTLKKFITDKLEAGEEVPLELFGGHWQRQAKVEVKKG